MPGYTNFSGGGFVGGGFGFGRGRGMGRGRGFRWRVNTPFYPYATPYVPPYTAQNEVEALRQEEKFLETSLEEIKKRLEQLETSQESDK